MNLDKIEKIEDFKPIISIKKSQNTLGRFKNKSVNRVKKLNQTINFEISSSKRSKSIKRKESSKIGNQY